MSKNYVGTEPTEQEFRRWLDEVGFSLSPLYKHNGNKAANAVTKYGRQLWWDFLDGLEPGEVALRIKGNKSRV